MESKYKKQTVGEFIEKLKKFDQDAQLFVSSDEELNTLFWGFEVMNLDNKDKVVIFGLSGLEKGELY